MNARSPSPAVDLTERWVYIAEDVPEADVATLGRELYNTHCVDVAKAGHLLTHDGISVAAYSFDDHFTHAFFTAATRARRGTAKDMIDPARVARAKWIAPIIAGLVDGTKCYRIRDFTKTPPPEKRLYVVRSETYVIWLIRNKTGFYFKTAYVTGHGDIERYIKRQTLIWERSDPEQPSSS